MSKKLEKVLEYLINEEQDKAKELLHQVFIEKARSIHEELMNMDEEDMDMNDDFEDDVTKKNDDLEDFTKEIAAEETLMSEEEKDMDMEVAVDDLGDEEEVDVDMSTDDNDELGGMDTMDDMDSDMDSDMDDAMDSDMGSDNGSGMDMEKVQNELESIEDLLQSLKDEFADIQSGNADEDAAMDADEEDAEEDEAEAEEDEVDAEEDEADAEEDEDEAEEDEDEMMDESWLAEFDDLEEGIELDKVPVDNGPEVGAGKFSADVGKNAKSPTAKAPEAMFGAKPVKTHGTTKSGYEREAAPSVATMKDAKDNRRKKATDGMKSVSKEGDGAAMLNKKIGEEGKKSPLSSSPRK